jgi:hypothetical protein
MSFGESERVRNTHAFRESIQESLDQNFSNSRRFRHGATTPQSRYVEIYKHRCDWSTDPEEKATV